MSFANILIEDKYRTSSNNLIREFYIPVMENSFLYRRGAGFFSSKLLVDVSRGIDGLIRNNGKMQLVVSPLMSDEDVKAIKEGYDQKELLITNSLINCLEDELIETDKDRLNLMIDLIKKGILDIKIAVVDNGTDFGMYHEKIGIMEDVCGNKIAIVGSNNESENALENNFESFVVFSTLNNENKRVNDIEDDFNNLWNDNTNSLKIYDFPLAVKNKLFSNKFYKPEEVLTENQIIQKERLNSLKKINLTLTNDKLYDYQKKAIDSWEKNNYVGIFDMATGTGKTFTALGAATRLFTRLNGNLGIIIICPYTHLVDQWAEDLIKFGFAPIIGYGSSKDKKWKENLKNEIFNFKLGMKKYFCFITTNATYCSDFIQQQISKISSKNILFIADEAHNLGAPKILSKLNTQFKFRLALSATFERYNDEIGTNNIFNYFGKFYAIHYDLKEAILNEKLTPYLYYPVLTYLDSEELEEYIKITVDLVKYIKIEKNGKISFNDSGKMLLLKRARIVAGSKDKMYKAISLLKKQYEKEGNITNTLLYCGATTINDVGYLENHTDANDLKQIDYFRKMIKDNLNINVAKFTSTETQEERKLIKEQFISKEINAIVAIKCLDEGVNIPAINTAYILASSTNPKEYIQRRGRVLRKAKGKNFAIIYDFITLPRKLEDAFGIPEEDLKNDLGLIRRELTRLDDFASDSNNLSDSIVIKDKIKEIYGELLNKYKEEIIE